MTLAEQISSAVTTATTAERCRVLVEELPGMLRQERERVVERMRRAWELRCDSYDPWPEDGDNDEPHDETAQHVFNLLLAAAEDEK